MNKIISNLILRGIELACLKLSNISRTFFLSSMRYTCHAVTHSYCIKGLLIDDGILFQYFQLLVRDVVIQS